MKNATPPISYTAPFAFVNGAMVKNLHVAGTITGNDHISGMFGILSNSSINTIENCRVSATINSNSISCAGFIAQANEATVSLNNCYFDGTLNATGTGVSGAAFAFTETMTGGHKNESSYRCKR